MTTNNKGQNNLSKKTRWNNLPNEILQLIVSNCGRDYLKVKWMFVNKQWFNFYLSLIYNSISIDSTTTDEKVNKIFFSSFNVGKYVKNITFKSFYIADSLKELDIASDCLSLLMKNTPNVEKVAFASDKTFDSTAWTYFSTIITSNEYWKLHALPEPVGNELSFTAQYYVCAFHFRYDIKRLNISLGMIGVRSYCSLINFSAVETLIIGKGVLDSFNGLDLILSQLPKVKALTVHFSSNRLQSYWEQEISSYRLEELSLINFTPKNNDEMLIPIKNRTT